MRTIKPTSKAAKKTTVVLRVLPVLPSDSKEIAQNTDGSELTQEEMVEVRALLDAAADDDARLLS